MEYACRSLRARVYSVLPCTRPCPPPKRAHVRLALLLLAVTVSACSEGAVPTSSSTLSSSAASSATATRDERASAPATLAWQARGRNLVVTHPAISALVAVRIYALLGVAQYGAAVAADEALGITGDDDASVIGADEGGRAQYEARRGAIGGASATILSYLFPDVATAMEQQLAAEGIGPNGRTHPQFTRGVATGRAMGDVMVAWARTDGFSVPWTNPPFAPWLPGTSGQWFQASATAPPAGYQFPGMRPYFMTSTHQFRPLPPPAFGSAAFLADLQVVRDFSDTRTAQQAAIANFWNLAGGTITALGYWGERAGEYVVEHGLGDRSASHIFALTTAAAMDAALGCWDAKYTYVVLRPSHADPLITRPAGRPGFPYGLPNHPSFPSGHSCVSAAAVTVLSAYFPEKGAALEFGLAQAGLSRVYGGIHYPFDISAGQTLGRSVGAWALHYDRTQGLLSAVGRD